MSKLFILMQGLPPVRRDTSYTQAVLNKINNLSDIAKRPTIDIATAARAIPCGAISGTDLVRLFKGQTTASAKDALAAAGVPSEDLVRFVGNRGLLSTRIELTAAIEFAGFVLPVLQSDQIAYDPAEAAVKSLRSMISGAAEQNLDPLVSELGAAKATLLAKPDHATELQKVAAIEAVLACVYMDPGAAYLAAGCSARQTAIGEGDVKSMADRQLAYLQALPI